MGMYEKISEPQLPDAPVLLWVLALPAVIAVSIVLAWAILWTIVGLLAALGRALVGLFRPLAAHRPPAPLSGPTAGKSAPQEP